MVLMAVGETVLGSVGWVVRVGLGVVEDVIVLEDVFVMVLEGVFVAVCVMVFDGVFVLLAVVDVEAVCELLAVLEGVTVKEGVCVEDAEEEVVLVMVFVRLGVLVIVLEGV